MPSFKSLDEASRWATDHDAQHRRERGELLEKVGDMNDAAIAHIEKALAPVKSIEDKIDTAADAAAKRDKRLRGVAKELKAARLERLTRRAEGEQDKRRAKQLRNVLILLTPIVVAALAAWKGCH